MRRPKPNEHVGHNKVHMLYAITCEEFDQLVIRSGGLCDRCGREMRKPMVDHDHETHRWAVRGLVCAACNVIIGCVDRCTRDEDPLTAAYFARPFHALLPAVMPGYRPALPLGLDRKYALGDRAAWTVKREDLVTLDEAAAILELSIDQALVLASTGRMIGLRQKTGWLFRRVVVQRLRARLALGRVATPCLAA